MTSFDGKSEYLNKLVQFLDLFIVASAYIAAIYVYPFFRGGATVDVAAHLGILPVILLFFTFVKGFITKNLEIRALTFRRQLAYILQEVSLTLVLIVSLVFLLKLDEISRLVLLLFGIGVTSFLIGIRYVLVLYYFKRQLRNSESHLRVLIVGSGRRAHMLADQLRASSVWGVNVIGFLDPVGKSAGRRAGDHILGHVNEISKVLRNNVVEDVIVAVPRSMLGDVQEIIDACQEEGVRLRFMANIYDFQAARIRLAQVNDIPLLSFEPVAREAGALLAKRIFDVVVTIVLLPLVLLIFLVTAVAIRLDSKGPIFFTQERVGLHKRLFKMYKFRSMVPDAEARLVEVEHLNEADGPNFKIEADPRVTRVGRFIRKTSIDELPQLFNVLLGDMSLVGPRPMSLRDVDLFDKGVQRKRFSVRPGITCLWQISGRSDLSFEDWLNLDLRYIDSWTFWLDIKILLRTVPVVLKGSGAV